MKRAVVLFDEPLTDAALDRKLTRLGFGLFQIQTIVACGFFIFYHAGITTLNRELLETSKSPFDDIDRFVFAITPFFGSLIGCLISFASLFSRKFSIISSYALIGICTLMAAMSTSSVYITFAWLCGAHIGLGLGLPSAILSVYECSPPNLRIVSIALLFTFQIIGEVYVGIMNRIAPLFGTSLCGAGLSSLCMYRSYSLESMAIPAFVALVLSAFWVHESPRSLGDFDCFKLNVLLRHIRETNGLSESDVVIKFVPPSTAREKRIEKILIKNLLIFSLILFANQSFEFVFPHPDDHWTMYAAIGVVTVSIATAFTYWLSRFSESSSMISLSCSLCLLVLLCSLGAWQSSAPISVWSQYVQSWVVLGVIKSLSLVSAILVTANLCCQSSPRSISLSFSIAFGGCIVFPNSFGYFSSSSAMPLEVMYAVLFGICAIMVVGIYESPSAELCMKKRSETTIGNFSKIPLIGNVGERDYGTSGA